MSNPALDRIGALLATQRFAALCTSEVGWPYASLVAVAADAPLRCIYFATPENTQKTANLNADSRVALLVDDRSNRAEDCQGAMAITILGRAEILSGNAQARCLPLYLGKHPNLKSFVEAADTVMVCVHVERYRLVEQFQKTTDVQF
jgi:uncharacterized protein YhbP (UPF0306 family)